MEANAIASSNTDRTIIDPLEQKENIVPLLFTVKDEGSPFHPSQEIPVKRSLTASTPTGRHGRRRRTFSTVMEVFRRDPEPTRRTSFDVTKGSCMAVVLVVEDEDQVRVLAESYLEEQGHQVLSAGTPAGALALLQQSPAVDLLFTDLDLKGDMHAGIELAKAAVKLRPRLQVLYTTGRAITDGMKARFVSGSATLAKPYTIDELRDSILTNFQIHRLQGSRR
jgi:CheY-like chemotaxis protein